MDSKDQHYVGEVAQKAIIEKEDKVLIARHPTEREWDLPGGRIHTGEMPVDGLAREIREELGIDVSIGEPFHADIFNTPKGIDRYFVCFLVHVLDEHQPLVLEEDEVAEIRWIREDEIENISLFPPSRRSLEAHFARKRKK